MMQYYYMKIFFLMGKGLHRRFVSSTGGVDVPITNGSGTGGDGPAITNDLNPTVPKTVGDTPYEPAVMRGARVVDDLHLYYIYNAGEVL